MIRTFIIMALIAIATTGFSQDIKRDRGGNLDKFSKVFDDEFSDNLRLRFYDAVTGKPVKGATIEIDKLGKFTTDREGKVEFPKTKDGNFTFGFEKEGYITCDMDFDIIEETIFYNQFSVCPAISINAVRVILDWGKRPRDLDANLVKENGFHISYRNLRVSEDGLGKLDRDDRDGYGPETITLGEAKTSGNYSYYVTDYTNKRNQNSSKLSRSKAVVRVFGNNRLLKTIRIPRRAKGTRWNVFEIKNGKIVEINEVSRQ